MKNRSRYEVIAAILKAAKMEETRTKITYKAMLSNDQCKWYLESMLSSGLIQEIRRDEKVAYRPTQKGSWFLSYYCQMKDLLPIGLEANVAEKYHNLSA